MLLITKLNNGYDNTTDVMDDFTCTCNDGFYGDGYSCLDFDECKVNWGRYISMTHSLWLIYLSWVIVRNIWMWNGSNLS